MERASILVYLSDRVIELNRLRDWVYYLEQEYRQHGIVELLDSVLLEVYELGKRDGQRSLASLVFRVYGHGKG